MGMALTRYLRMQAAHDAARARRQRGTRLEVAVAVIGQEVQLYDIVVKDVVRLMTSVPVGAVMWTCMLRRMLAICAMESGDSDGACTACTPADLYGMLSMHAGTRARVAVSLPGRRSLCALARVRRPAGCVAHERFSLASCSGSVRQAAGLNCVCSTS